MSLGQHLIELRNRLFISGGAAIAGAIGGFWIVDWVMDTMRIPINQIAEARDATISYSTVTGAFDLKVQIAFTIGIVISSPVWLYQIFAFIAPGLTRREKQYTFGFVFAAIPLFLAGGFTGWVLYPHTVLILANFAPPEDATLLDAKMYYDFVLKFVIAVGVAFVLPVFVVLLNFIGLLSAQTIRKGWRYAILGIVLFTALTTPAGDFITMFVLAIPMILLYAAAWVVAALHDRSVAARVDRLDRELAGSEPKNSEVKKL
jgi:sec-independent protein translocase protein TatC